MIVLETLTPIVVLAAFALLAARFGRDSRDGLDRPPPGSTD
ncbi:MAG TPA: hypothetical protein VFU81_00750 [Thermomicrobiales bacterium]|nr:hypothetical protein [Thermomicrobiales bacterium]